jgi:uncharacterized membrane protein
VDDKEITRKFRKGLYVFIGLLIVEVAEYIIGVRVSSGNFIFMVLLAVPGSWLIVHYFMHIKELWLPPEE